MPLNLIKNPKKLKNRREKMLPASQPQASKVNGNATASASATKAAATKIELGKSIY